MMPRTRSEPILAAGVAAAVFLAAVAAMSPARAQSSGSLSGRVVDAATGTPVPDVVVTLEPATAGLIPDTRSAGSLAVVRTVVTGGSGYYRFTSIGVGAYRLRIERIGYRPATLEVEVLRPVEAGLSVALELDPVSLEPVIATQRAAPLFQRASYARGELDAARRSTELERQSQFLSSDTRVLTYADVMDGVTLGGGDVFRALQRFAGVGTRDDYTAELWTRGAPWTQTRVTFDGVPLFNPVHAVGVLSAIAPEVLGTVHFHPGVRPPSLGEGAAGAVDMRTRPGTGSGELGGAADVSAASAKLVLDQRVGDRIAWLIAGRRSHLGVLTDGLDWIGLDTLDLPYVFHDVAGRIDVDFGGGIRFESSGLWEEDRLDGDIEGVLERTRARWGNTAARVTLRAMVGPLEVSQTAGLSRFDARVDERMVRTRDQAPTWTEPESRNSIEHVQLSGELAPAVRGAVRWSLGYDVSWQNVDYNGPFPRYHAVQPDTSLRMRYARELTVAGVWGNVRAPIGPVQAELGLRLETSAEIARAPMVRPSPRAAIRVALSEQQTVSLSAGRTWQHAQSIALAGPSIHPAFHATHFWLWADARTPAIRADIVNLGTERWLGPGWLATVNAFVRFSDGLTLPDPTSGRLAIGDRPLFVRGTGTARGVEAGLRRIGAGWSASLGHTYGESEVDVRGVRYPAPADRRHVLDVMAGAHVWRGLRVAAAYTAMTGAPFTRANSRSPEDCTSFGFGCEDPTGSWLEAYNAERTPDYRSLDASLSWSQPFGGVAVSGYVQLRNVLARDNASTYAGSGVVGTVRRPDGDRPIWDDRFEAGLPRIPLVGLRVTF